MDDTNDRELEAILNLVKLTQNGIVKWQAVKPWGDLVENESTKYLSVMFCDYMDKKLRLFVEQSRVDKPSGLNALARLAYPDLAERTYPYWDGKVVLEIANTQGQSLWRFPSKPATKDLLDAAKYQVAGVRDILDSLLKSPDASTK